MSIQLRELQERRNKAAADLKTLGNIEASDWSAEHDQKWTEANERYDLISTEIADVQKSEEKANERRQRQASIDQELRGLTPSDLHRKHPALRERDAEQQLQNRELRSSRVLLSYLQHGAGMTVSEENRQLCQDQGFDFTRGSADFAMRKTNLHQGYGAWTTGGGAGYSERGFTRAWEQRTLGTPKDGSGGETIPEGFQRELERAMLDYGGISGISRHIATSGFNPMPWPTVNDTTNAGDIVAENTEVGTADPAFAVVTFNAYKFTSDLTLVSAELLEDSAFNLGTELASMLGERLARGLAGYLATGTGTGQPEGAVTASAEGPTTASGTAITADELIDTVHSVDPAYRRRPAVGWCFNDATLAVIRKLKDSEGDYLWRPGLTLAEPDLLLGFRYTIDQAMPSIAVNAKPILFGDWSKFVVRDHASLRFYRLDERYREFDQSGFLAFRRHDSHLIDAGTNPLKHLLMAAA